MVEVFKTNITDRAAAARVLGEIHRAFANHRANFDLDDCDHILRVEAKEGKVEPALLLQLVKAAGFHAEAL